MQVLNDLLTRLSHVDPLIWTALASYLAPYGQELLKQVMDFSERANYVLALVVIPALIALLSGALSPHVLGNLSPLLQTVLTATFAAVVSQLKYGLSLNPRLKTQAELSQLKSATVPTAQVIVSPAEY